MSASGPTTVSKVNAPDAPRSGHTLAIVLAVVGNAALIILSLAWLQIPDARTWQVGFSLLLALLLVLGFLWLQTNTLRAFAEERSARVAAGMAVFAVLMVVAYLLLLAVGLLAHKADALSFYWNSVLPRTWRYWITQRRILDGLEAVVTALRFWVVPGLLLPLAVAGAAYRSLKKGWCAARYTLLRGRYWLLLGLDFVIAYVAVLNLMEWQPGVTPHAQVTSLVLRTLLAYLICVTAWLVAMRVACVRLGRRCRGMDDAGGNA